MNLECGMRLTALFLLFPLLCSAQLAESPYSFNVELNTIAPESGGDVNALVVEVKAGFPIHYGEKIKSAANISHERQLFDTGLGFDHLIDTQATLFTGYDFNENWRLVSVSSLRVSHEEGVDALDSVTFGGIYGAWYTGYKGLLIGGGFGYTSRLDDDFDFFPILLIDWTISDEWTLTTRPTPGTRFGPGASLLYQPNEKVGVFFGGLYLSEEFLLSDEEIFRYETFRVFTTAQYRFKNNFSINATIGLNLFGEIEFEEEGRVEDLDTSLFGALNVSWDF